MKTNDTDFFATNMISWNDPSDTRPFASRLMDAIREANKRGISGLQIKKRRKIIAEDNLR